MVRYVYDFAEGGRDLADLLGGKGANLAEMTLLGLPVPPGFTVTTEACRTFLATGTGPDGLAHEIREHLTALEQAGGRRLGQPDDPLLLSVRSGARFSMPGMMETILDIGLNDDSVLGLAKVSGNESFAWDSYRRLVQMFGSTVLGVDGSLFENAMSDLKRVRGAANDLGLNAADLAGLVETYKDLIHRETREYFPQSPDEQLRRAVLAVFESWKGERAQVCRRREHIADDLGTAVNVQTMVFGNFGPDSGSGVAFTRDPATGRPGLYGDYLANAQGEDVVAGIRNTVPLTALEELDPTSYLQLQNHLRTLETHYRDLCDIEFTIERGRLWMLQTRVGKRTAEAAFAIAAELVDEDLITADEGLARVSGDRLARLMFPRFDTSAVGKALAHGLPASPGAAVGAAVFDSAEAVRRATAGEKVVLVRQETTPDDLPGMIAAQAVVTSRGGKTSHAAVVARGMGTVCVCGAEELTVDTETRRLTVGDATVDEGTVVSVDGSEGAVYLGAVPLVDSAVMRYFETGERSAGLVEAVAGAMERADSIRRLEVRANADTPEDAARARRFGAQGVGLCRTEHMFLGARRKLVEAMILARDKTEREEALSALLPLQRQDFIGILEAMDGLPVTIRLIDPPLHEFLPDHTELAVRVATAEAHGTVPDPHDTELLDAVGRMHEENPMLGLRGVRLGLVVPGLVAMQVRAIAEAVVERTKAGGSPEAEIMVPLVGAVEELRIEREEVERVLAEVSKESGVPVHCPVGTMIELSRAALMAGPIAEEAEFFSFGTNDLTQTTWGFSRDDVEAAIFSASTKASSPPHRSRRSTAQAWAVWSGSRSTKAAPRATRPEDRRLRRARRGSGFRPLLPCSGPRLRLLLAVSRPGRASGGRAGRAPRDGDERQQVMRAGLHAGDGSPSSSTPRRPDRGVARADGSWHNRAGVEHVMGLCTKEEYQLFLRRCPIFERMLVEDGILQRKHWFSVSDTEPQERFRRRSLSCRTGRSRPAMGTSRAICRPPSPTTPRAPE